MKFYKHFLSLVIVIIPISLYSGDYFNYKVPNSIYSIIFPKTWNLQKKGVSPKKISFLILKRNPINKSGINITANCLFTYQKDNSDKDANQIAISRNIEIMSQLMLKGFKYKKLGLISQKD